MSERLRFQEKSAKNKEVAINKSLKRKNSDFYVIQFLRFFKALPTENNLKGITNKETWLILMFRFKAIDLYSYLSTI